MDRGVRVGWEDTPKRVRREIETWLNTSIESAVTQPTGFSPGVAARLTSQDGRRFFVKAVGPEPNIDAPDVHRREINVMNSIPDDVPVPRLLWSFDEGENGWVALVFEDVEGHHPIRPWLPQELNRVVTSIDELNSSLTPSPLPKDVMGSAGRKLATTTRGWRQIRDEFPTASRKLDPWSRHHIDSLVSIEDTVGDVLDGDTLLNMDIRADNILLTPERTWFVDWPHAVVGPKWLDVVAFAPSVTMQGGPLPEDVISKHSACRSADFDAVTAAVVAIAGFFTHQGMLEPPPGLPTLRAFQRAQGKAARGWISRRAGLP